MEGVDFHEVFSFLTGGEALFYKGTNSIGGHGGYEVASVGCKNDISSR